MGQVDRGETRGRGKGPMPSKASEKPAVWFLRSLRGDVHGPYSTSQVRSLLASGKISQSEFVSRSRDGRLQPLFEVEDFQSLANSSLPPPLPVPRVQTFKRKSNHSLVLPAMGIGVVVIAFLLMLVFVVSEFRTPASIGGSQRDGTTAPGSDADHSSPAALAEKGAQGKRASDEGEAAGSARPTSNRPPDSAGEEKNTSAVTEPTSTSATPPSTPPHTSFEDVVADTEQSVCIIQGGFSTGTGFLVAKNKIITNKHVISDMLVEEMEVIFPSHRSLSGKKMWAEILYEDEVLDAAILKIPEVSSTPLVFEEESAAGFRRGRDVIAIGSPGTGDSSVIENAVSRGLLSSEVTIGGTKYYQVSISVNPGNSGGPLIGLSGQVLGMITLKGATVEGIAYAIPAGRLREILQKEPRHGDALLAKKHDARVVATRIALLVGVGLGRLDELVSNIFEGIDEHDLDAQEAFEIAIELDSREDHSMAEALEQITMPVVANVVSAGVPDARTCAKIGEFWQLYREVASLATSPRGSANSMRDSFNNYREKAIRMRDELEAALDLPDW